MRTELRCRVCAQQNHMEKAVPCGQCYIVASAHEHARVFWLPETNLHAARVSARGDDAQALARAGAAVVDECPHQSGDDSSNLQARFWADGAPRHLQWSLLGPEQIVSGLRTNRIGTNTNDSSNGANEENHTNRGVAQGTRATRGEVSSSGSAPSQEVRPQGQGRARRRVWLPPSHRACTQVCRCDTHAVSPQIQSAHVGLRVLMPSRGCC